MTAPQLARLLTHTTQLSLVWTALTGAVTLAPADFAARLIPVPLDVPVGALTALVGAPYLLWLPGRSHR
ncbi:iron chelate uptake ABC transporter family permease subunit [Streptomyces sp. NPDC057696]|uniref:iron chelate uptake ABC transporter family permease subunit n=1 Tax=unclassified Streptomyces TaxID=2593676 RepID=UPI0036973522